MRSRRAALRSPEQVWGRRAGVLGAVLLIAAALGAVALLTDEEGTEPVEPTTGQPSAEELEDLADRTLTESLRKRPDGLVGAYPPEWRRSERQGVIRLESPDRCVVIALSAPAKAADAKRLREDSIAALRRSFKKIRVRPEAPTKLGGVPTTGVAIAVRNREGAAVAIRLSVSRGPRFAHLTEVIFRSPPCEASLPQTQLILDSIEFRR